MERRYRALRVIGTIYQVLGGIAGIVTILLALAICATSVLGSAAMDTLGREFGGDTGVAGLLSGFLGGVIATVLVILYGFGFAVTLYALGEGVYLLLALEENTRATVALLQQRG